MVKYVMAAATLKAFSLSSSTKQLYRSLGNSLGSKKRTVGVMPSYYLNRLDRMLRLNERHRFLRDGHRVLELGTGWLHWEAITCRLFFDIEAVLYDVWDNRQLEGLKNYLNQLVGLLPTLNIGKEYQNRASRIIGEIRKVNSFRDLYDLLGFQYVIDRTGRLKQFDNASFDVVVSAGVLEHVGKENSIELIQDIATVLKPSGYSCHSIQIGDHLASYDRTVSAKQYLRYSHRTWKRWFENDVQYINRLQRSDWLELFDSSGLILLEEEVAQEDLSGLKIAPDFHRYTELDLRCSNLKLLHQKKSAR